MPSIADYLYQLGRRVVHLSGRLSDQPDLLAGPAARPLHGHVVPRGRRVRRHLDLAERLDLEAAVAQQADALAVREVELHAVVVGPGDAAEAELRVDEPLLDRAVRDDRRTENAQHGAGHEEQPTARPKQPGALRDPHVRIA